MPRKVAKRRRSNLAAASSPNHGEATTRKVLRRHKFHLKQEDFAPVVEADRCLTCGEGEQLGHPGRNQTRKPRAIDTLDEKLRFVDACAGGVHSLILSSDGRVFSCGCNEKGTVPVNGLEAEGITDEFTEISFTEEIKAHGKLVQLAAGASFSAALTDKGSVVAWGNLRDSQGDVTSHTQLSQMQKGPVVIVQHSKIVIVKIAAGENHLAMLSSEGELLTFGEGSMGQLGRLARSNHIRSSYMADDSGKHLKLNVLENGKLVKFQNVFAGGFWTIASSEDGRLFACGLNNYAQLGLPLPTTEETHPSDSEQMETDEKDYRITRLTHVKAFDSEYKWTHIAGVQHLVLRNENGEVFAIGKNTDNILGLGTWKGRDDTEFWRYDKLQKVIFPEGVKIAGVNASLACTIAWTDEGESYSFGFDSAGQLGLGIKDDEEKIVPTPRKIQSAHLDDYKVLRVSVADQHAVFLAQHK
ncbi:unnamed protein product [Bursaphelenchus xylophilus]|uniref:(pine wood nematode) hypothetical protein n=1 Tax=Bursaphelenchus xylophilus TaxID=6326 RepID=A0A1I7RPM8_BURXY|nr:unnamed protein product [Bursaphelenchus xylophilus]CAG9096312.1 unnamed protein product [Bursaphelenchus xylophilus]